ncbi:Acyl-CoA synthetase (AMP-forming)/AMP-acid ligase II [Natranaeroarchaeum sulfidigenes]|uniref:Acyl-CoA synthetase (AMP-forming)/AMP-acid ligase II n=2 Tax=Natranaeroarchaeum sulfidigenes TaxID=2784880 RepID=A0A897MTA2_9EURY|nr:AMP-binding protein [Natranaeroarchaeum sulfidigenes]QSG02263.1 Acyl-CoA synthetase (AMP-forming)/AMP-acid ligase II [Natranaeroarchaeum sulfidigenes]
MTGWPDADLLAMRAVTSPDALAVIDAGDGSGAIDEGTSDAGRLTYADLDALVDDLARRLSTLGIEPDSRVAALLDTGLPFVAVVHALDRLGAVLVPLNVRLTQRELVEQCEHVGVETLLHPGDRAEQAADLSAELDREVAIFEVDGEGEADTVWSTAPADALPAIGRSQSDRRLVLFTSGTTGEPKAVPLTTGNLVASAVGSAFRLGVVPDDRWLCCLPMYHMGGLAPVLRSTLYGTCVVLQSTFDAERTPALAREHEVTALSLVPTMLARILDGDADLPDSLRFVLLGGGPADPALIERADSAGVPVCPTYGMTETASQIATARPAEAIAHEGTVGRPLLGTEVSIVDEQGTTVEAGDVGEVVVSGPTVTPGYLDDAVTERSVGPRGLHTGDLGYRDDGNRLWITGRRADRIVTGGENVDPVEVRETLCSHPAVADAAVVGLDDEEWGERVGALVVVSDGETPELERPDSEALRAYCRDRLAGYKLPRTIEFADTLPRTPSGTIDRTAVRVRLGNPE